MIEQIRQVAIRDMNQDDIPTVVSIDRLSFPNPWPERSYVFELNHNPNSRLYVAEVWEADEPQVVGFIGFWFVIDEAHISTIAVHPSYRGRGIGDRLLVRALQSVCQMGGCMVSLEVRQSNEVARRLYQKYGFEKAGRRKGYYRDNHEDAILMTLSDLGRRCDDFFGGES